MERYFLLIFDGVSGDEKSFLMNYFGLPETSSDNLKLPSLFQLYSSTYVYFLNIKKRWKKHIEWKEMYTAQDIAQPILKSCEASDEDSKNDNVYDSSSMAECINTLADHLPLSGTFVLDVIIGCNVFENNNVDDNLEFAASLHRLSEWHSARTFRLTPNPDDTSNLGEWLDLTRAEATDINSLSPLSLPFWRGAVELKNLKTVSTQCCSGFELRVDSEISDQFQQQLDSVFHVSNQSKYLHLHPILKVTDVCSFSSIPQHLILPAAFKLYISRNSCYDSSRELLANIKKLNNAALILKMSYALLDKKPKCDNTLTTNKWIKMVLSGNVKYPESCLPEVDRYLTLAVVSPANSDDVFAYVIRDTSLLDAQLHFSAVNIQHKLPTGTTRKVEVEDLSVPFISQEEFLSSLQKTTNLHTAPDGPGICKDLSVQETNDLLTTFIQTVNSSESSKSFVDVNVICDEVDPSDWPERVNLLQRQMQLEEEKNLRNLFTCFSPKRSQYFVTFSGDDIKKYFEPSGEAKDNKIAEPIQSLSCNGNYNKDSLEAIKEKKWPDILNCAYGDIYYNVSQQSEDRESMGNHMVKCYVQHETASTCNNHQSEPDAPISIQAKFMTPRKRPKSRTGNSERSFRQAIMKPNAGAKAKFLKTAEKNHVFDTIIKTLGVRKSPNVGEDDKKRVARKNSLPVRFSPRKRTSVNYFSSSKGQTSTSKLQKSKTVKGKSSSDIPEILKKKLRSAIANALESNSIKDGDDLFKPCFRRLFSICQGYVQDIQDNPRKQGTSQYLQEIAEEHVKPVIKFEKKKRDMK